MPKKGQGHSHGHGHRGGGGAAKGKGPANNKAPNNTDDGLNIVFSNAKDDPKPAKTSTQNSKGKNVAESSSQAAASDAPKRPDTRKLIGGASWTGKLPMNLLSEHCQKQRWDKPEYTMHKQPEGFSSMVILKSTHPKTKEHMVLPPFKLPPTHKNLAVQATAVEARHFAATYALFRVCSMKNLHMMLPPTYRDLWKGEFQELKKEDEREARDWMYAADPFAMKIEREEAHATAAKKREEIQKRKEEAKKTELPSNLGILQHGTNTSAGKEISHTSNQDWRWKKAPKVDMGRKTRTAVEDLVRKTAVWNPYGHTFPENERISTINDFTQLGFRKAHIEEAVAECKDREETLEWLLIHVPEDDLPSWSLPENYSAGVSMASSDLKREASIKRLSESGYSRDLCEKVFDKYGSDEARSAEILQQILCGHELKGETLNQDSGIDVDDPWTEEQATLEAIFGDHYNAVSPRKCQIKITLKSDFIFQFQRPTKSYPENVPVILLQSENLPAYIRLSIIRQAIHFTSSLLGEPMIFNIIDWLENNIQAIVENPGKLREISAAASVAAESKPSATNTSIGSMKHGKMPYRRSPGNDKNKSLKILADWKAKQAMPQQKKMQAARESLPAWSLKDEIVAAVNKYQITIISGETGSGKSTQSVQFILDDLIQRELGATASIVCTQPRRISALGLADRVSDERCSTVGDEVGYAIRGESKFKPGVTKISFVTTGVLLRRLQNSRDPNHDAASALADVTHVVVDEVHERSLDTDFLLILMREILQKRSDLKLILMSATLDSAVFSRYFGGPQRVGQIEIQGRTYPVEDVYLDDVIRRTGFSPDRQMQEQLQTDEDRNEKDVARTITSMKMGIDYDLIAATVRYIDFQLGDKPGGVLIFLPGTLEINRCLDALSRVANVHGLPLHASLPPAEQRRVFLPPPHGKRKVIAATNVAETSITIEDIVAVIDTGRVKETSFDPQSNMVRLDETWASQAACKQRRGRAGRVRAGTCYKLFTRNAESKMLLRPDPEITRVPLEQLCLSVKAMGVVDVSQFISKALTPPKSAAVEGAITLLHRMGALDNTEITALGRHLALIPADLRCSKLLVYGTIFDCLDATLTIAAILTVKSPFVSPQDKRDASKAARRSFAKGEGDIICDLRAYEQWSELRANRTSRYELRAWCDQNFLSERTLFDISSNRSQLLTALTDTGLIPPSYSSTKSTTTTATTNNTPLLRALIAGSFNPQTALISLPTKKFAPSISGAVEIDPEARTIRYFNEENGRVFVHPSSTLFDAQGFPGGSCYMSYFIKGETSKVFIRELTPFNPYTALLLSGPLALDIPHRGLRIDNWLHVRAWSRIGVLVSQLRKLLDKVLAAKIDCPGVEFSPWEREVVEVVGWLVRGNGLDE
ncbi:MAG: hypothetical protein M1834_001070 [Cirrosporium novae-zelandiae]|nr:MAG: hypothetical protein M1834_001070 [Cirrosporium novae-zelandiae]